MKILSLPTVENGYWNTKVLNPKTGKLETHGNGLTVSMGGKICEKVTPTDRQLKRIRNDIDKYLKYKEEVKNKED